MNDLLKSIGALNIALMAIAIPLLTGIGFVLNWNGLLITILVGADIFEYLIILSVLLKEGQ